MTQFAFFRPTNSSKAANEPSNNNNIMKWTGHKKRTTSKPTTAHIPSLSISLSLSFSFSTGLSESERERDEMKMSDDTLFIVYQQCDTHDRNHSTHRFGFDFDVLWPNEIKPFLTVSFDSGHCYTQAHRTTGPKALGRVVRVKE